MATGSSMPPMLRFKRSSQSGSKVMTAAYAVAYTESSTMAYIFGGGEIDLSPMLAGDTVDIRIRKQLADGGGWVNHDEKAYNNAPPTGHPSIHISPIPDIWGVEISMRQTAGALITIVCEFYDAKRLGLG